MGFRYYVVRAAESCRVRGFVRNLANGTVEIIAEGQPDSLETFVQAVRTGPPFARVTKLDRKDSEVSGSFDGFEVRY